MANPIDMFRGWFRANAQHMTLVRFPPQDVADEPLVPDDSYFRVWLVEAFLARGKDWFTEHFPAVHTSVQLTFASDPRTCITTVIRPPADAAAPGAYGDYALTPLLPYRGGTVDLDAGLAIAHGANGMEGVLDVLQDFSGLVGPPIGEAIGIADRLTNGVQRLLAPADGTTVLGLHQAFEPSGAGGPALRPGYLAVVNSAQRQISSGSLSIVDGRLHITERGRPVRLRECDFMVFRIEGRTERTDWRFRRLNEMIRKVVEAHFRGEQMSFVSLQNALMSEIFMSEDLTMSDRVRAATTVREELEIVVSQPLGAAGEAVPDLSSMMSRTQVSHDDVVGLGHEVLEQLLLKS